MNKLKSDLYKNGYVVVKNLLSEDEITHFSEKIKKICETKNSNRIDDLYNYQEFWDFIINRKTDRIGLLVFGKETFIQCPLTIDYNVLTNLLSEVTVVPLENIPKSLPSKLE